VTYSQTHYPTPKVLAFLTGVKMDLDEGDAYSLDVRLGTPLVRSVPLQLKTRDKCKVKSVRVALFITAASNVILGFGGAAADNYNHFEVHPY
jgi:hypothetical protein